MAGVEKTAVYFADAEMSDVILIVGDKEFHVHKMSLAIRSSFFKAMFYSNFIEKNQDRVVIETDPVAFERLLEYIYNGHISNTTFLQCTKAISNDFWNAASALWAAFNHFGCEHARELFTKQLKTSFCTELENDRRHGKRTASNRCIACADRFIFAWHHGIDLQITCVFSILQWFHRNTDLTPELREMFSRFRKSI